jgi:aryl-alcohol dehydrogenase-like predicted oxidoreductase
VNAILRETSPQFARLYAEDERASVPPEWLLRALLLQIFYSIRSERMLIEQLHYNTLFRWFVGLSMDDPVWHATTFTKNRQRLLDRENAREFFAVRGRAPTATFDANMRAASAVRELASRKGVTPGQIALAWLLHKGSDIVPIPGTKRRRYFGGEPRSGSRVAHR